MIKILDKTKCCGCGSCIQRCPKQCITVSIDNEGFFYPVVDTDSCVNCGLCDEVCPVQIVYNERTPKRIVAAYNKDVKTRINSSSGGLFSIIAETVIRNNGVVFGVKFNEQWQPVFSYCESTEELADFRGSKYIQAFNSKSFKDCERFLKDGRQVLFSGTPCQIAALHRFLRKSYDNLYTVDIVCHGVPSNLVWDNYMNDVVNLVNQPVRSIRSGLKRCLSPFDTSIKIESNTLSISSNHENNPFMYSFVHDLCLRPSCYACQYKKQNSCSDVTLADFWGVNTLLPEMYDNKGTSVVVFNNERLVDLLDKNDIIYKDITFDLAKRFNPSFFKCVSVPEKRTAFFKDLNNGGSLSEIVFNIIYPTFKSRIKFSIVTLFKFIKRGKDLKNALYTNSAHNKISLKDISHVSFRNKDNGWDEYMINISFKLNKK